MSGGDRWMGPGNWVWVEDEDEDQEKDSKPRAQQPESAPADLPGRPTTDPEPALNPYADSASISAASVSQRASSSAVRAANVACSSANASRAPGSP